MRYQLLLLAIVLIVSCNDSGDKKKTTADTTTTVSNHDNTHNPPASGTIPALPAVPEGARVFFKNLKNNATISSPFKLEMGNEVIRIDTAGPVVDGSGHHHLLINGADFMPDGEIIPKDSLNIHFGKGETEHVLSLRPGKYKLTLQMADGLHRSYGSKLASSVMVTVKK